MLNTRKITAACAAIMFGLCFVARVFAQDPTPTPLPQKEKAEAVIAKAVQMMGGDKYLAVRSQIGKGMFSQMREGTMFRVDDRTVRYAGVETVRVFRHGQPPEELGAGSDLSFLPLPPT